MKYIKYNLTTSRFDKRPAPNIRYDAPKHLLKGKRKDFEKSKC